MAKRRNLGIVQENGTVEAPKEAAGGAGEVPKPKENPIGTVVEVTGDDLKLIQDAFSEIMALQRTLGGLREEFCTAEQRVLAALAKARQKHTETVIAAGKKLELNIGAGSGEAWRFDQTKFTRSA